jgi:hypothetical protein
MVVGAVVFGSSGKQGGSVVVVRGEVGNAARLFVGVERRFISRYFELAELRQWRSGKVRRGLRPTEFAVNSALWDCTHRAGELAEDAEEGWKAATRCGVEVTGRQGGVMAVWCCCMGWVVSRLGRLGRERGRGWRAAPASCRALGRPALGQRKGSALDQGKRKEKKKRRKEKKGRKEQEKRENRKKEK